MANQQNKINFDKVTRKELVDRIKEKDDRLQGVLIKRVLELEHEVFVDALSEGKEIQIKGHLTIYPHAKKGREGYNPFKQTKMFIADKVVTKVEAGGDLVNATKDLDYNEIKKYSK